jgi:pSer/pThr/pTyr-binding forkhead associated (FHA) protein
MNEDRAETTGEVTMRIKAVALIATILWILLLPGYAGAFDTQDLRKGVVRVVCRVDEGLSMGTGFVINDSGTIITNHHVIAGGQEIRVLTNDLAEELKPEVEKKFGDKVKSTDGLVSDELEGEILGYIWDKLPVAHEKWSEEKRDLAILECGAKGLSPLSLTRSDLVHDGETVYALGYPGKGDKVGVTAFLTLKTYNGIVSARLVYSNTNERVYQTTATFSEGNSGGPLVDEFGGVIGINFLAVGQQIAHVQLGETIRYSIQIDELIPELDARHIAYKLGSPKGDRDWFVTGGIVLAIILGFAAIGVASRRGRQAVKEVVERSRQLVKPGPSPDPHPSGPHPAVFLAGIQGEYAGRTIPLDDKAVVMGRDPSSCQLVFPTSCQLVSKRHCALRYDPARRKYLLEDLGSANGTFVISGLSGIKDERLAPGRARELNATDRFYLGGLETVFELRASAADHGGHEEPRPSPVPVLLGVKGEYQGRAVEIGEKEVVMGRDPGSCQLVLWRSSSDVSKRHCSLRYDKTIGAFVIEDLSSTNGTFVVSGAGPEQIKAHTLRRLKPGDRFFLGDPEVLFEVALE